MAWLACDTGSVCECFPQDLTLIQFPKESLGFLFNALLSKM